MESQDPTDPIMKEVRVGKTRGVDPRLGQRVGLVDGVS